MEFSQVKYFNIFANGNDYLLFLKEIGGQGSYVPIMIGGYEANNIMMIINGENTDRPYMVDIFHSIMQKSAVSYRKLVIYELKNGLFYAQLNIQLEDGTEKILSVRPSDGIVLAIKFRTPIFVSERVLKEIQEDSEMLRAIQVLILGKENGDFTEEWGQFSRQRQHAQRNVSLERDNKIDELNMKLEEAINDENYEQAAKIRDRILRLKKS